jgi:hypothetical protein
MKAITIRRGLRRLEFSPQTSDSKGSATHVVVEFAVGEELTRDQIVRIHLGLREGLERILEGHPKRLPAPPANADAREFLYRLEGEVG